LPNWTRTILAGRRKVYTRDGPGERLEVLKLSGEENWRLYHAGKDTGYLCWTPREAMECGEQLSSYSRATIDADAGEVTMEVSPVPDSWWLEPRLCENCDLEFGVELMRQFLERLEKKRKGRGSKSRKQHRNSRLKKGPMLINPKK
jgi:hypothetical protein